MQKAKRRGLGRHRVRLAPWGRPIMEGRGRNVFDTMAFLDLDYLYGASMYQWPVDCVMDESLEIAMNYLSRTGQAVNFMAVQNAAAEAIITAWQGGVRHKIRLANYAIRAVETRAAEPTQVQSVYPRVM